ncbi:MAG: HAD family hydrolase [Bryobacterales bacterium]|nr:HAD family hydrolase [Bryobacterales bacterium]
MASLSLESPRPSRNGKDAADSQALVLFDIDGTLIRKSGPQHKEALEYAVWRIVQVRASLDGIPTHGMLDTDLVTAMARRAGVPVREIREAMPAIIASAERRYARRNPGLLTSRVCPGVRTLLRRLERRGIPLLLVTGNFPRIGWKKLELAGLKSYFLDGAFAGMSSTRAGLARLAMRAARQQGWAHAHTPVSLVGDSPNDIRAAHANGIRSIAVSTGINSSEQLRTYSPHVLVETLVQLRLEELLGRG